MRHVLSALVLVALALASVTAAAPLAGAPNCRTSFSHPNTKPTRRILR